MSVTIFYAYGLLSFCLCSVVFLILFLYCYFCRRSYYLIIVMRMELCVEFSHDKWYYYYQLGFALLSIMLSMEIIGILLLT